MTADQRPGARTGRSARVTAVVAVVLALVCIALLADAARTRQVVTRRRVNAAPISVSIDGCPATASCTPNGPVRPTVLALVRSRYGSSARVTSSAVVDRVTGRTYGEILSVQAADGVDVAVSTRCVAGGSAVTPSRPASVPAVGPADLSAVVAGVAGCSAGVAMHVDAGVAVAAQWSRALSLVTAPLLQLRG